MQFKEKIILYIIYNKKIFYVKNLALLDLEIKTRNFDLIKEQCASKNSNNQCVLFQRVIRMWIRIMNKI